MFLTYDKKYTGYIRVTDVTENCDFSLHPNVAENSISTDEALQEMLKTFVQGNDDQGNVFWIEFLDYYRGLSLVIDDDSYFEYIIKKMWNFL